MPDLQPDDIAYALATNIHLDIDPIDVALLQNALSVEPTGSWDEATVTALARWQGAQWLAPDGIWRDDSADLIAPTTRGPRAAGPPTLSDFLASALAFARTDWQAEAGEQDTAPTGRLAAIFRDSGWSFRVDTAQRPKEWCGLAVAAWLHRAGLPKAHRATFFHTSNIESFFTYAKRGVTHRTRREAVVDGAWTSIEAWHTTHAKLRGWRTHTSLRAGAHDALAFEPGDIVLTNRWGRTDSAHHITMVASWDGKILQTIEGNASGTGPNGRRKEAVILNDRDLSDATQRNQLWGAGRLSPLDFTDVAYR